MANDSPRYTLSMCNYNMSNTIEPVIRSCLDQVDERFEMLVVDDGSTDESVEILDWLSDEYVNMRYLALDPDKGRELGETRNISVREARGEYVLPQVDADDRYDRIEGCFDAFVELFHQIEDQLGYDFYLSGRKLHVGRKSFLLERGPYRNLPPGGEDWGLWRRLHSQGRIIFVYHKKPFKPNIGHHKDTRGRLKRSYWAKRADFRTGITLSSSLRWNLRNSSLKKVPYHLVANPIAYLHSKTGEQYHTPRPYRDIDLVHRLIRREKTQTLSEIERRYGVEIDRCAFDAPGRKMFENVSTAR